MHRWSSLLCTAFLLMLCVTGLPLIFHDEIDGWLNPPAPLNPAAEGRPRLDLDTLLARALADRPGEVPLYMSFDTDRPVVNVTSGPTPDAVATDMHFQSLDARTGEVLPMAEGGVMDVVLQLHTDMMLGLSGELFLGAMGLLFAVAIISGLVLYVPFMQRLAFGTVRHERTARVRRIDRHNLLGVVTLAWALVVGVTGTINTLVLPITTMWKADQLAAIAAGPAGGAVPVRQGLVQPAMDRALAAAPGMTPQFIGFPGVSYSSDRHLAIFLQGDTPMTARLLTPAFVDARTGRLDAVQPMPWYMQALLLAQPLHFGDYAGLPMKILWAILDLMTIAVLWTGLRLWIGRRRAPAGHRRLKAVQA
ncbi:putative iron-regulated membrane protein [Sphingomonas jejuensis]|uniref:Iron-regulated membrane protein n=1 Tax=Sphingomonas jejuensis TaxID=904715 RepID=A0ABX0XLM7_9SPHN|nr:putative iron-regulated membrane protein [Sphingomonas jejuensis]